MTVYRKILDNLQATEPVNQVKALDRSSFMPANQSSPLVLSVGARAAYLVHDDDVLFGDLIGMSTQTMGKGPEIQYRHRDDADLIDLMSERSR